VDGASEEIVSKFKTGDEISEIRVHGFRAQRFRAERKPACCPAGRSEPAYEQDQRKKGNPEP
jgi:hypothetical protein